MLMIVGWADAEYGPNARQFLQSAVARLCMDSVLSACLAALPVKTEEREWLLGFLSSLKRAASVRSGVLISTANLSTADLLACDTFGLNEVVLIHQSHAHLEAAKECLRSYREERPHSVMSIVVWLDETISDGFQAQVCAWKHGDLVSAVELAPFAWQRAEHNSAPATPDKQPLSCEWLRSVITVTPNGAVVPCPANSFRNGNGAAPSVDVVASHAALRASAGSSPVCRSCRRLARFAGENGILSGTYVRPGRSHLAMVTQYRDFVGGDLRELSVLEQKGAIEDFLERIRALKGEGS